MPTSRPRTQVTHTDTVQHALEVAAQRWPGQKPSVLLTHLIEEGARVIESEESEETAERRSKLDALIREHGAVYGPGYLDDVRDGWDE